MIWAAVFAIVGILLAVPFGLLFRSGWHQWFVTDAKRASYDRGGDGRMIGGAILGGALLLVFLSLAVSVLVSSQACSRYGDRTGYPTEFQIVGGCYVGVGERMVPQDWVVPVVEGERLRLEIVNPSELP